MLPLLTLVVTVSKTMMPLIDWADENGPKVIAEAFDTVPELAGVPAAPNAIVVRR
jgi:hypothetical protein